MVIDATQLTALFSALATIMAGVLAAIIATRNQHSSLTQQLEMHVDMLRNDLAECSQQHQEMARQLFAARAEIRELRDMLRNHGLWEAPADGNE